MRIPLLGARTKSTAALAEAAAGPVGSSVWGRRVSPRHFFKGLATAVGAAGLAQVAAPVPLASADTFSSLVVTGHSQLQTIAQTSASTVKYYPHVVGAEFNNNVTCAYVIKTGIPRASFTMFTLRVRGYAYGNLCLIDFTVGGYAYGGTGGYGNIDNILGEIEQSTLIDHGSDGWTKYLGVDPYGDTSGKVSVALGDGTNSTSYVRLAVDAWITGATADYASGWTISQKTTDANHPPFGWGDQKGPLSGSIYIGTRKIADSGGCFYAS